MLIGELAERTGVHPVTLRRLERRGLITSRRDVNGWRVYGPEAEVVVRQLYAKEDELEPCQATS
jgi:DNA-binding transcriptional MerR regulator